MIQPDNGHAVMGCYFLSPGYLRIADPDATGFDSCQRVFSALRNHGAFLLCNGCIDVQHERLRTSHVVVSGKLPHIHVERHEDRRIKADVSRRKVPLAGAALAAAKGGA